MRHSCLETSTETVERPRKHAIASGAAAVSAESVSDSRGRSSATASSFLREQAAHVGVLASSVAAWDPATDI